MKHLPGNIKHVNVSYNQRKENELDDVAAYVTVLKFDPGTKKRVFHDLTLERSKIPVIPLTWTIVHPAEERSPFYNFKQEEDISDLVIYVRISGTDSVTGQPVFSGHSYAEGNIIKNAKFCSCQELNDQGETLVYLNRINEYEELGTIQN